MTNENNSGRIISGGHRKHHRYSLEGEKMHALMKRRLCGAIPSQVEAAKVLGVRPSAVSKWERGEAKPRIERLPAMAKLYGCTVEDLLKDIGGYDNDGTQET